MAPAMRAAPAPVSKSQYFGVGQARGEVFADGLDVCARLDLDHDVGRLLLSSVEEGAGSWQGREDVRQGGEGTDAFGDGMDVDLGVVDFRGCADAGDAKVFEVGLFDGDAAGGGNCCDAAFDDVPRGEAAAGVIGADHEDGGGAASGFAPVGKADNQLIGAGDTGGGKNSVFFAAAKERWIVETFGADRYNPEVAVGMILDGGDGALGAKVKAALDGDEDDRKDDADQGDEQAGAVMEEVAISELGGHSDAALGAAFGGYAAGDVAIFMHHRSFLA
jgi:hypothetical protein